MTDVVHMMTSQSRNAREPSPMRQIVSYYEETYLDYRLMWSDSRTHAYHFGYYNDGIESHRDALENANRVLARIADVRSGERVLDAGCGLGGSACWLAANIGAIVTGITPVLRQVAQARRVVAGRGLQRRVSIEFADFCSTPFPDECFDVVWALESLCHAMDKSRFYREARRLLRPGGRLVVAEYIRQSRSLSAAEEVLLSEWLRGWAIPDLDTRDEHLAAASKAGFSDARVLDYTAFTRPSLLRLHRLAQATRPLAETLQWAGLITRTQYRNVLASVQQGDALLRRLWFYGMLSATKS
jgi:tocopherol O-methyltransferase